MSRDGYLCVVCADVSSFVVCGHSNGREETAVH